MSYKPQFHFTNDERQTNGQSFATEQEALASAAARWARWLQPTGYSAVESDAPVTYRYDDAAGDIRL